MRHLRTIITSFCLSASLVAGLVPASALAEMTDTLSTRGGEVPALSAQGTADYATRGEDEKPVASYRLGDGDAWRTVSTLEEALAREADDVMRDTPLTPQVCLAGVDGVADVQLVTAEDGAYVESLQIGFSGEGAATHDIWYRVHVSDLGWLGWTTNAQAAGTKARDAAIDGLQVLLVEKDTSLPDNNPAAFVAGTSAGGESDATVGAQSGEQSVPKSADATDAQARAGAAAQEQEADRAEKAREGELADKEAKARAEAEAAARAEETKARANESAAKTTASNSSSAQKTSASSSRSSATSSSAGKVAAQSGLATEAQAQAPSISYQAHVQSIGWQKTVADGAMAGTSGQSLRMEALRVTLSKGTDGGVEYQAHVQSIGWQDWVGNGEKAGTEGQALRVEGFRMRLTGELAKTYDIYYRTHIQQYGWLDWAKNGEATGSEGLALRMEALEVQLVEKGSSAPSSDGCFKLSFINKPELSYRGHVQYIGWQDWVEEGEMAGTAGQGLRVEALETDVDGAGLTGEVHLNAHVQRIGWQDGWGTSCGTEGQSLRVEAICAQPTGDLARYFDVYYRVHAQNVGWMGWAKNGEQAGTSAMSLRLEAIEMRLVRKGGSAPGSTENRYLDGNTVTKLGYQNPAGFYQVSSKNVTITSEATAPWNYVTPSRIGVWATRQDCINAFIGRAREYLGTPYVWDYSCAPGVGVDCIGLVYQCAYACGMDLGGGTDYDDFNPWAHWITGSGGWHSHDANNFWDYGRAMHVSLEDRQVGDLISWTGHVAIYLGDDEIIEAYPDSVMYSGLWDHGTPRGCIRLFQ